MKVVNSDWIVVDAVDNEVGFVKTDSLALVDRKKFPVDGYLQGAVGVDQMGSKFIYLWFSCGNLFLIDGLQLK